MSKSVLVPLDEVRAVFALVAECCEQGHDPAQWQAHLAEGMNRLLRGQLVIGGEFRFRNARLVPVCAVTVGWPSERAERTWAEWQVRPDMPDNPIAELFLSRPEPNPTCAGFELIARREWERTEYHNELMVPSDMGDTLVTRRTGPDGSTHLVTVSRTLRDRDFGPREKAVLALLHDALAPHLGRELATASDPVARLTPRLREVLRCLLEGDTEKEAARRLSVAPATLHDHVKALYRHFGVGSRPQLTAYFLRRGWKLPFGPNGDTAGGG